MNSRWWKTCPSPMYFWTDLKTDYTVALISSKNQIILVVRASLTNECEVLLCSLVVIIPHPIWIEAINFTFCFLSLPACDVHVFQSANNTQSPGKMQENFKHHIFLLVILSKLDTDVHFLITSFLHRQNSYKHVDEKENTVWLFYPCCTIIFLSSLDKSYDCTSFGTQLLVSSKIVADPWEKEVKG